MSKKLNGGKYSPEGSRVPTDLLPNAIRWESARATLFYLFNRVEEAEHCSKLVRHYQQRTMDECV